MFANVADGHEDSAIIRTSLSFTVRGARAGGAIAAERSPRLVGARLVKVATAPRARQCDYSAPAALFVRTSSGLRYRGFESASMAIRHTNEELPAHQRRSCVMEVGEARFTGEEIERLYAAPGYPLVRRAPEA